MSSTARETSVTTYASTSQSAATQFTGSWQSGQATLFVNSGDVIEVSVSSTLGPQSAIFDVPLGITSTISTSGPLSALIPGGCVMTLPVAVPLLFYAMPVLGLYVATEDNYVSFSLSLNASGVATIANLSLIAAVVGKTQSPGVSLPVKAFASWASTDTTQLAAGDIEGGPSVQFGAADIIQVFASYSLGASSTGVASLDWTIQPPNATVLVNEDNVAVPWVRPLNPCWAAQERTSLFLSAGPSDGGTFSIAISNGDGTAGEGAMIAPVIVAMVLGSI